VAWIYQSPADGFIKELGFIQPEDKTERIIVWKVDTLQKGKEFCGSTVRVTGSFITTFFTFFRFRFFMFNLTDVIVFVRLPKAGKEVVKGSDIGSVTGVETTEDGLQRSYFKHPAPSGNGIYFQHDGKKIGTEQAGRKTGGGFAKQGIKLLHDSIRFRKIKIPEFHNDIPGLFRDSKWIGE
jgi:hypothetical protein